MVFDGENIVPIAKVNTYTCDTCNGSIITIDVDEGVTPFMLRCRATPKCPGTSRSALYREVVSDLNFRPHYLWVKPDAAEYEKLNKATQQHVDQGGLVLIAYEERWAWP